MARFDNQNEERNVVFQPNEKSDVKKDDIFSGNLHIPITKKQRAQQKYAFNSRSYIPINVGQTERTRQGKSRELKVISILSNRQVPPKRITNSPENR